MGRQIVRSSSLRLTTYDFDLRSDSQLPIANGRPLRPGSGEATWAGDGAALEAALLTDAEAEVGAAQGGLRFFQLDRRLAVGNRVFSVTAGLFGPGQVELFSALGGVGQDQDFIVRHLHEAAEDQ